MLTIDLTNRCNMMCDPCFMDANQVGYVHELDARRGQAAARRRDHDQAAAADVGAVLRRRADDLADLPRRGRATRARSATSASRRRPTASASRRTPDVRDDRRATAGLRIAYLQFDGIGEEANAHRKVGNLFDVKLRAIENLHRAGIDVCLVVTIVNTVNNDQVGPIVKFALENCDKISFVSFQPVSFTGRDEDISDADRARAALHALAPRART